MTSATGSAVTRAMSAAKLGSCMAGCEEVKGLHCRLYQACSAKATAAVR